MHKSHKVALWCAGALAWLALGCVTQESVDGELHRWWSGLGPVLPHDTFPDDCRQCHVGDSWNTLKDDFTFDHERRTGVALKGAHAAARCLLCHNDRGPVQLFAAKGCVGCHEDYHQGELGKDCTSCHDERNWRPRGQVTMHNRTRFPLTGAHLAVGCHRCHPGAFAGRFANVDNQCIACHRDDLERTANPPHVGLGWVNDCDRCHATTSWNHATLR